MNEAVWFAAGVATGVIWCVLAGLFAYHVRSAQLRRDRDDRIAAADEDIRTRGYS